MPENSVEINFKNKIWQDQKNQTSLSDKTNVKIIKMQLTYKWLIDCKTSEKIFINFQ